MLRLQDVIDTPDYTVSYKRALTYTNAHILTTSQDSDTGMTTTESSIAGDLDGRKKRWEGHELRKTVLGKKHDKLGMSKVFNTRRYTFP
jgi:SWI/SNF-related matrix-associated actin-dependent regulator of chromatin subfamily A member 5